MKFTPEQVADMAKEAGLYASHQTGETGEWHLIRDERFAALVATKEREAIQLLIEELDEPPYSGYENPNTWDDALIALAALIRARGGKA